MNPSTKPLMTYVDIETYAWTERQPRNPYSFGSMHTTEKEGNQKSEFEQGRKVTLVAWSQERKHEQKIEY